MIGNVVGEPDRQVLGRTLIGDEVGARELARRSVEARKRKWGKAGFKAKMRAWGKLGGRPKGSGKKRKVTVKKTK